MKTRLTLLAGAALALITAFATAPRDGFETGIYIDAPPQQVWALLTDADEHAGWNPGMLAVEGRFAPGERLRLSMAMPSGGQITFRPCVLVAEPGQELRWLGRLGVPRIFDGEHYFILRAEGAGTWLTHGEDFRGLALWFMDVAQFRPAFIAANEGLKRRAEAVARGVRGDI